MFNFVILIFGETSDQSKRSLFKGYKYLMIEKNGLMIKMENSSVGNIEFFIESIFFTRFFSSHN